MKLKIVNFVKKIMGAGHPLTCSSSEMLGQKSIWRKEYEKNKEETKKGWHQSWRKELTVKLCMGQVVEEEFYYIFLMLW
jgi:hypothetical protein